MFFAICLAAAWANDLGGAAQHQLFEIPAAVKAFKLVNWHKRDNLKKPKYSPSAFCSGL
jgi:hypothetical protein